MSFKVQNAIVKPISGTYMSTAEDVRNRFFLASDKEGIRFEVRLTVKGEGSDLNMQRTVYNFRIVLKESLTRADIPKGTSKVSTTFSREDPLKVITGRFIIDPKALSPGKKYYVTLYEEKSGEILLDQPLMSFVDIKPSEICSTIHVDSLSVNSSEWIKESLSPEPVDVSRGMGENGVYVRFDCHCDKYLRLTDLPFKAKLIDRYCSQAVSMCSVDDVLQGPGGAVLFNLTSVSNRLHAENLSVDSYVVLTLFGQTLAIARLSDLRMDKTQVKRNALLDELPQQVLRNLPHDTKEYVPTGEECLEPVERLQSLIGLDNVKEAVDRYMKMHQFLSMRESMHLKTSNFPLHAVFYGSPGTGKTTVAKLMGEILFEAGLLSKGHVVVTERSKLVGEFIGQTEKMTMDAIYEAQGGILFIDEAYQLDRGSGRDFGTDITNTLLTSLADTSNRGWMVILAGYTNEMQDLLKVNPGLSSRFPNANWFYFHDYTAEELMQIAMRFLSLNDYRITDSARAKLYELIAYDLDNKDDHFGNARHVINIIETGIIPAVAMRVSKMKCPTNEDLCTVLDTDIPRPVPVEKKSSKLGFCI